MLKLLHIKNTDDHLWYWVCPVCFKEMYPHEAGKCKGHQVLQSKGVATKHLIAHNAGYVPKVIPIGEITNKNNYFCNKCGNIVLTKRTVGYLYHTQIDWKPEHKFICLDCSGFEDLNKGLKTKDEVHKGKIRTE